MWDKHVVVLGLALVLAGCGGSDGGGAPPVVVDPPPPQAAGPAWLNHGRDAQHSARGGNVAAQSLSRMVWRTDVDLAPVRSTNSLDTGHYGSPVITGRNTVLLPVRTTVAGTYRIEARDGGTGALRWQADTDFVPVQGNYSYSIAATPAGRIYYPGVGGKLYYRDNIDATPGAVQTVIYYGAAKYTADKAAIDAGAVINTPVTTDEQGNTFFGVFIRASGAAGLAGALVRVDAAGTAKSAEVAAITGDNRVSRVAHSAAPALSPDGKTVYVVVTSVATNQDSTSYLVALDSSTLAVRGKIQLIDPETGKPANVQAFSTASPMVGPDGDVYYGVVNGRGSTRGSSTGWLLHYDAALTAAKTPGAFGWDYTPTSVPASAVGGYTGQSSYLLVAKYNSYNDGQHRMAVLDPHATQPDKGAPRINVMKEVITILGVTRVEPQDPYLHEWCINTGAFDPNTKSVFVNNSDGYLYRWDLSNNTLAERFNLNTGYFQSYTPTALGPDGKVYAINNAMLTVVGK
jgi:hypothetical protein